MGDNLLLFNAAYLSDFDLPVYEGTSVGRSLGYDDNVVNLGDLTIVNLHFENYKAFGKNFNYFVSLVYFHGSNGQTMNTLISGGEQPTVI